MFAGREVVTVEGLSNEGDSLHPVQSAMVDHYGSQCGYCTPGFVMSLFEGYYRGDCRKPGDISDQLCGNLCRCTGYRPIRDAALDALGGRKRSPKAGDPFQERLKAPFFPPGDLDYRSGSERFVRPTTLAGLFAALKEHPGAALVAGATEIGVDVTKKFRSFPLLVSTEGVPELTRIVKTDSSWRIGAGANLTAVEEAMAGEYPSLAKMLRVFAARQIRNRATLGGNLATASPIGDGAPVLLSLDAELVLASAGANRTVALSDFFTAYRKTLLAPGEIILEVVVPRFDPGQGVARRSDFFKVSKRRELDISIVAAAFSVDTDSAGVVRRARIAYGGVAATPVRARLAEAALEGRKVSEAAADVATILSGEFKPIDDVRGSAEYRRGLIVSLWEKFVSRATSAAQDGALGFPRGKDANPPDQSRALRHESAVGHVTGRALYADDTAQRRPMLDIWPVCSPHAHARMLRRDATAARAMPGVVAVLMAEDIPGHNNVGTCQDEPLFAYDEVKYHGQVVAIVVGSSLKACRAAAAAVVVEYEPLPTLIGIKEAIAGRSFHAPPHTLARGDVAAALAKAPLRLEGEFSFGGQEHFYLETQAAWAEAGEGGSVFVSSSTQHPTEIQAIVAEVLGEPRNKVVVQSPRMGGGFGGKETQGNAFAAMVALAAIKTRQPVRIQLDRDVDMMVTGKRHPFDARFSVGYDRRGMILAAAVDLYSDGGWSLDLSQPVLDRALFHLDNGYYIPAVRFTGLIAKTNVASNTAFRGFGGPQGMLVMEEIVDRISRRLGLAPEVVRGRNLYRGSGETNTTHFLQEIGDNRLQTVWKRVQKEAGFAAEAPDGGRLEQGAPPCEARTRGDAAEVRDLLHADSLQPGRCAGPGLLGRHSAGEPWRDRDGAGAPHEDSRRGHARIGTACQPDPDDADSDGQGAQHVGHRGVVRRGPERGSREKRLHHASRAPPARGLRPAVGEGGQGGSRLEGPVRRREGEGSRILPGGGPREGLQKGPCAENQHVCVGLLRDAGNPLGLVHGLRPAVSVFRVRGGGRRGRGRRAQRDAPGHPGRRRPRRRRFTESRGRSRPDRGRPRPGDRLAHPRGTPLGQAGAADDAQREHLPDSRDQRCADGDSRHDTSDGGPGGDHSWKQGLGRAAAHACVFGPGGDSRRGIGLRFREWRDCPRIAGNERGHLCRDQEPPNLGSRKFRRAGGAGQFSLSRSDISWAAMLIAISCGWLVPKSSPTGQ